MREGWVYRLFLKVCLKNLKKRNFDSLLRSTVATGVQSAVTVLSPTHVPVLYIVHKCSSNIRVCCHMYLLLPNMYLNYRGAVSFTPTCGTMEVTLSGSQDRFQAFWGSVAPLIVLGANVPQMAFFFLLVYCPYGWQESTCVVSHVRPVESGQQKCLLELFFFSAIFL